MAKVYERVYGYFKEQIEAKRLKPKDRVMSLRETGKMLGVSRTSVETAFLQLAADGYIYPVEKVGYFVSDTPNAFGKTAVSSQDKQESLKQNYRYGSILS